MRRQRWFEIHDSPWFPAFLRDLVTESLEAVWNANHTYRPVAGRLREAIMNSGSDCVVDLCSGGGGPWLGLYDDVAAGRALEVRLTDLHPNGRLFASTAGGNQCLRQCLHTEPEPVDALCVPPALRGFRTIFSSFHHFDPIQARGLLADACAQREGIGVFEAARCNAKTMFLLAGVPILALRTAAAARPIRTSRIVWTYLLPVVPLVLWVDGLLSCLRSYSLNDMRELSAGLGGSDYDWQIGEENGGSVVIRYLIGTPRRPGARSG